MLEFNGNDVIKERTSTNDLLSQTFFVMFLGLLATALSSIYTFSSGLYLDFITNNTYSVLLIVEFAVVLIFSFLFRKLSAGFVRILFFAYAFLNGVTLSTIFAVFEITSIVYTFIATAGIYAALAYIGKTTKADLSKLGTILYVTLIAGLILTIINFFMGNSAIDIFINWVMLFIFMGFTIYDMNKLTHLSELGYPDTEKLHIYGAMELYLDFIQIFLRLLLIFGKSRD